MTGNTAMLPLWIKIAYTAFAVVTAAVYSVKYPLGNFLWFSDIALIATVPALWLESSLLASMMAVGIFLPEVFWAVGYFTRALTGRRVGGLTDYMFDGSKPRYLRALSFFHLFLPPLLLWMVARLGYAREALAAQTLLAWAVLPLTFLLTDPERNVNWVFGPHPERRSRKGSLPYLGLMMAAFPLLVYLPTHLLLTSLFR